MALFPPTHFRQNIARGLARLRSRSDTLPMLLLLIVGAYLPGALSQDSVCGTKFHDLSSSAILAPLVLKGHVRRLDPMTSSLHDDETHERVRSENKALYQAEIRVHAVYKGEELLGQVAVGNSTQNDVMVKEVGEEEDKELCVGHVVSDQSYLFFLRPFSSQGQELSSVSTSSSAPVSTTSSVPVSSPSDIAVFVSTALPHPMNPKALRAVKKALCPGCAALPIIQRVKCKNCATPPVLKRPMSSKETKTLRIGRRLSLRCAAKGNPSPSYIWLKDGRVVHDSSKEKEGEREGRSVAVYKSGSMTVRYSKQFSVLIVNQMTSEDTGTYSCLVANPMGEEAQSVKVKIKGHRPTTSRPSISSTIPLSPLDLSTDTDDLHGPCPEPPCGVSDPTSSASPSSTLERNEDPCTVNPCYNGGSCIRDEIEPAQMRCQCLPDYHGNTCQFRRRAVGLDEGDEDISDADDEDYDDDNIAGTSTSSTVDSTNNISSTDNHNATTITVNVTPKVPAIQTNQSTPVSASSQTFGRGPIRKKKKSSRRRHGSSSSSKTSKTGAPKLQVSDCPDSGYCLNGGTCKIVVLLQRRFCECVGGYGGRRCERAP